MNNSVLSFYLSYTYICDMVSNIFGKLITGLRRMQIKNITTRISILTLFIGLLNQNAMAEIQGTPLPLPPPSTPTQEIPLIPPPKKEIGDNKKPSNAAVATTPQITAPQPITNNSNKTTPNPAQSNFDRRYLSFIRSWQIPGSAVAIIKDGKLVLSRGYGMADVANQSPVRADSVFRVASVSKAITAVTVLQLVQQGKLKLDDKVYYILNDLHPLTGTSPLSPIYNITVRNLLEMSSGWITNHGIDPMFGPWTKKMLDQLQYQTPPDCRTAAQMMMTIPFQYAPGKQYSYSNINYCLLGLIINKVTGLPGYSGYETYVQQRLLAPYGITSMRIGDTMLGRQMPNEVRYYYYSPNSEGNPSARRSGLPYGDANILHKNYSDGGWIATAPDLAKFVQALGEHKILGPNMLSLMSSKPYCQKDKSSYFALGWSVKYIRGHRFILKTGSFTGTQALIMLADNGIAYAALFNAKPGNRRMFNQQLQNLLVSYTHPETGPAPTARPPRAAKKIAAHHKGSKIVKKTTTKANVTKTTKSKSQKVVKKQNSKLAKR